MKRMLLILCVVLSPVTARADKVLWKEGDLTIPVPKGWRSTVSKDSVRLEPKAGGVTIVIAQASGDPSYVLEQLVKRYRKQTQEVITRPKKRSSIGPTHMTSWYHAMFGTLKGEKVSGLLMVFRAPPNRTLTYTMNGTDANYSKYAEDCNFVLKGMGPTVNKGGAFYSGKIRGRPSTGPKNYRRCRVVTGRLRGCDKRLFTGRGLIARKCDHRGCEKFKQCDFKKGRRKNCTPFNGTVGVPSGRPVPTYRKCKVFAGKIQGDGRGKSSCRGFAWTGTIIMQRR